MQYIGKLDQYFSQPYTLNVPEYVRTYGILTCLDFAAALSHFPAPKYEHWAAATVCHSDLQTGSVKTDYNVTHTGIG